MKHIEHFSALGLFDARVPRYTSYPTAAVFSPRIGATFQSEALAQLDPRTPVSVYIHIPFCERLCWFCACHTQGSQTLAPVEGYIETLEPELALLRNALPSGSIHPVKAAATSGLAVAFHGDHLKKVFDTERGEGEHLDLGGAVDPDPAIFRLHADGEIMKPINGFAQFFGDTIDGLYGVDLDKLHGQAA